MTNSKAEIPAAWQPLLDGDEAARARAIVEEITTLLSPPPDMWLFPPPCRWSLDPGSSLVSVASLADGLAGISLLHAYHHLVSDAPDRLDSAFSLMQTAFTKVAEELSSPRLFTGFPGVAWAANHIQHRTSGVDDDSLHEVDELLLTHICHSEHHQQFDLVHGLVGLGVYFLQRLPRPMAREALTNLVKHLDRSAYRTRNGTSWLTVREVEQELGRERRVAKEFYLGAAHGITGVIAFLSDVMAAGIAVDRAASMLQGAVQWIQGQLDPEADISLLPTSIPLEGGEPLPGRMAWCSGDLGASLALYWAGRRLDDDQLTTLALILARHAAGVEPERTDIIDSGICHGAAGAMHIFNRFYQATGEQIFADAARKWFQRILNRQRPGEGLAGFFSYQPSLFEGVTWRSDPGLLTGVSGVGLVLLAATSVVEPGWDSHLLMSPPLSAGRSGE